MTTPTPDFTASQSSLWDSIIIGGGPAGLAAAVALGRSQRSVLVIDAGQPRNRFASHMHTVLGHEGMDPAELLRRGRDEASTYGVSFLDDRVAAVRDAEAQDGLRVLAVELEAASDDGPPLRARSVIAAAGLTDRLPDIPGVAERWGSSVLHCPYCHGWEVRGRKLGVLAAGPMALHQAELLRQWSADLTFFSAAAEPLEESARQRLEARGVVIEPEPVFSLHGAGQQLSEVELRDGRRVAVEALFTAGEPVPHEEFLAGYDLARSETPLGSFLAVDQSGRTSHERIWAPGNLSSPSANVPMAISSGTMAGAMANMSLISEEFDLAVADGGVDANLHEKTGDLR